MLPLTNTKKVYKIKTIFCPLLKLQSFCRMFSLPISRKNKQEIHYILNGIQCIYSISRDLHSCMYKDNYFYYYIPFLHPPKNQFKELPHLQQYKLSASFSFLHSEHSFLPLIFAIFKHNSSF